MIGGSTCPYRVSYETSIHKQRWFILGSASPPAKYPPHSMPIDGVAQVPSITADPLSVAGGAFCPCLVKRTSWRLRDCRAVATWPFHRSSFASSVTMSCSPHSSHKSKAAHRSQIKASLGHMSSPYSSKYHWCCAYTENTLSVPVGTHGQYVQTMRVMIPFQPWNHVDIHCPYPVVLHSEPITLHATLFTLKITVPPYWCRVASWSW